MKKDHGFEDSNADPEHQGSPPDDLWTTGQSDLAEMQTDDHRASAGRVHHQEGSRDPVPHLH